MLSALIPGVLPANLSYEGFVGLWLNKGEILNQTAFAIFVGMSMAGSLDDVPGEFFLAVCDDEASAFEMMVKVNNARSMAKLSRQQRSGVQTTSLF